MRAATAALDDPPCCWLCLEEGPDESGKPLIRNCSCRGSSGFAHLSCIIDFAENKSRQAFERDKYNVEFYFRICPGCDQYYQDDVKFALAKAELEFVEREYKNNHLLYIDALKERMITLDFKDDHDRPELEIICSKILSIIEEVDNDPLLQYNGLTRAMAMAQRGMGSFRYQLENLKEAKKHFEQAKHLYEAAGDTVVAMGMDRKILMIEAKLSGNKPEVDKAAKVIYWRKLYNECVKKNGENHLFSIDAGILLATVLGKAYHTIEAERHLKNLVQISRRVLGIEHKLTKKALAKLQEIKVREVYVSSEKDWFQALRYESDGEKIVVQGPLPDRPLPERLNERNLDEEKILTVASNDIVPTEGTPVVVKNLQCSQYPSILVPAFMRLKRASYLNGKIGDIRAYSEDDKIFEIHFEEEGFKPTKVKLENVSILFGLPEQKLKRKAWSLPKTILALSALIFIHQKMSHSGMRTQIMLPTHTSPSVTENE